MDNCIVCLESNADAFSRISTQSSEWNEGNIQRIVEKHLWWWHLRKPNNNDSIQWICRQCWQEISSFHYFYNKVEKEHKQQHEAKMTILESLKAEAELLIVKEECKEYGDTLIGDIMPLEKRKRGRKKNTEKILINELPVAQVKSENDLSFTMENLEKPKDEYDKEEYYEIGDIMDAESLDDIWEPDINNDSDNDVKDVNIFADTENHLDDINYTQKPKSKRKPKATKVPKRKKKEIKIKTTRKLSDDAIAKKVEMSRENDKFLAENKFDLLCCICNAPLTNFQILKSHYRNEHNILGYVLCCNRKWYKRGLLVDHIRVHQDPNYFKCPHCEKILANRTNFDNHLEYHKELNGPRELTFTCEKCNKSFFKKSGYDRHQLLHVPEELKKFQCKECNKKFASGNILKQHIAHTHTMKYAKICDICGKLFRNKFTFVRHMDEHNGAPPPMAPCDICGVELANKYLLNRHKKKLHTEEGLQKQICPYCSKVSPNVSAHRHHVQYAHTLERKHACHLCDKKFRRPLELKEHVSTHTGEPLYNCPHCPRTFISSGNLHKHRKLSHRREWEEARLNKLTAQQSKAIKIQEIVNTSNTNESEQDVSNVLF